MAFKNHYHTLGVSPNATQEEIKRKYRQLVMQYHPDKNQGNEFAIIRFAEIQEAYNTLTDSDLRLVYHQEWKLHFPHISLSAVEETSPESIEKEAVKLMKFIHDSDMSRLNRAYILRQLSTILSDQNLALLLYLDNRSCNTSILKHLLNAAGFIRWKHAQELLPAIEKLQSKSDISSVALQAWSKTAKWKDIWDRLYPWLAFTIALLLCLLFYWVMR